MFRRFFSLLVLFMAVLGVAIPHASYAFGETPTTERWQYFRMLDTLCIDAFDPAHCSEVEKLTDAKGSKGNALVIFAARLLNIFLGLVGIILVGYIVYGGWRWMTAAGDTEKVQEGKDTVTNGVIGVVIIFSAFIIANFVVRAIVGATR